MYDPVDTSRTEEKWRTHVNRLHTGRHDDILPCQATSPNGGVGVVVTGYSYQSISLDLRVDTGNIINRQAPRRRDILSDQDAWTIRRPLLLTDILVATE